MTERMDCFLPAVATALQVGGNDRKKEKENLCEN